MIPIPFSYILVYAVSSLFCKIALSFLYVMLTVLTDLKLIQGEPGPRISPRLLIQVSLSPSFSSIFFQSLINL